MIDRFWALLNGDGACVAQLILPDGVEPSEAYNPLVATTTAIETGRQGDLRFENWEAGAWVPNLTAWSDRLLAEVDAGRRAAGEALMSAGRTVHYAYAEKAAELRLWDAAAPEDRNPMDYPWFASEAAELGETLAVVAERVRAAKAQSDAALRVIEAKAQAAKAAIRSATTLENMQAAATVNWEI